MFRDMHVGSGCTRHVDVQEREAKRAKLKSENAQAYIQENSSVSAKHVTMVGDKTWIYSLANLCAKLLLHLLLGHATSCDANQVKF